MKNSGKTIGSELALYTEINAKGWTIRKFMEGRGKFSSSTNFFVNISLAGIFFSVCRLLTVH